MALEVRLKKDKSLKSKWWYGRFKVNGQNRCLNLGVEIAGKVPKTLRQTGDTAFERSRMKAQLKLEELKKEALSHKTAEHHLRELYELKAGGSIDQVTLAEMEDCWELLPAKRKRAAPQIKVQKANIRKFREFIEESFSHVTYLSQINRKMAILWIKHLKDLQYSGASHNAKLAVVRGLFEQLGPEAGIVSNPFAGIPYQALNCVHRKPFTEDELIRILRNSDEIIRPVILVGMCTAMRRGDCCLLKWESVDLENGFVTVKTSKTGEFAEIPLFPVLREELEKRPRKSEYVFPEAAEMYQSNSYGVSWRFKQALKGAEIEGILVKRSESKRMASQKDFHSLRTTWITMALTAGVPMELVRRVTGHSTVNIVLKHYFRPGREDFREALESALPRALTGGTRKEKTPAERLKELVDQADEFDKEELVEEMARIAETLAA